MCDYYKSADFKGSVAEFSNIFLIHRKNKKESNDELKYQDFFYLLLTNK